MTTPIWIDQAQRLKPFDGELIPVRSNGCRIEGSVKNHNLTIEDVLAEPDLKAIELRTSSELICLDFDSEKAFVYAEEHGFNWAEHFTWFVQRDNQLSRIKILFRRTPEQQKLGEFSLDDKEHDLEVFSQSTKPVTVIGHHRKSGIYRWWGTGPEKLSYCPEKIWNFIAKWKEEDDKKKAPKTRKSSSRNWQPARPCPICSRPDPDCWIHKNGNLVQCHHGKSYHPPSLRIGETIHLAGIDWAFCKEGENAIGRFSLFKIHKPKPLAALARKHGVIK